MVERVTAIDDAFGPDGIESFLQSLNVRGARISSNPRGFFRPDAWACRGAFVVDTPTTSFLDVYQALTSEERIRVEAHYAERVQSVPDRLRQKYPRAFRM